MMRYPSRGTQDKGLASGENASPRHDIPDNEQGIEV